MVKEFGTFWEDFVKEYIVVVDGIKFVGQDLPYQITKTIKNHKTKVRYPTDIDLVGFKHGKLRIIECKEKTSNSDAKRIIKKLKNSYKSLNLGEKKLKVKKYVATIKKCDNKVEKTFKNGEIEIMEFEKMFNVLQKKYFERFKDKKSRLVYGPFGWLIRSLFESGYEIKKKQI